MSGPARLTFHHFDGPILDALQAALHQEMQRGRGGPKLDSAMLLARSARRLREELPYASDGLMVRSVLLLKRAQ